MSGLTRLGGESMGTHWSVQFDDSHRRDLHAVHGLIEDCLDTVVRQMSTWEPQSEISRFNAAPAGSWHPVSIEFFSVLECALSIARASAGAFDPTVGRLVSLWGFGAQAGVQDIPAPEALDEARRQCGWSRLRLDPAEMSICQPGGMMLDLSAIAKGFSVDLITMRLQENGIHSALVEVGGELHGYGSSPRGSAWNVLLETGADEDEALGDPRVIALGNAAIATSGDHWFRYERDGRTVSHSLDPRTGEPVSSSLASVSVIADTAMKADAWATALSVMGIEEGLAFAQAQGIAARFVTREGETAVESCSPSFAPYLVEA